ncbi:F0F1 ATP synthase subunit B [Mechercharimyces sp. CAU 1602]|uniref:F0F1 ATP synthase subunit B n=1 Tax=Mechercharimyces sp. CAU 1602 TaxID=2973933 RepID=UPI002162E315|nr:F0F1 ATP synthase subunit B [Mechercharimyces sp. CAU 1602]MCS1352284.1 F0F1 ATP synthase subunit B [Mechercharimyces sp. CAU 1602]
MSLHVGTMAFLLAVVLVLMLLVSKFALRPMVEVMRKRQSYIDEQISAAENSQKQAEQLIADQQAALKEARNEAHAILERAKKQKEQEAQQIIAAANERAEQMLNDAKAEIIQEKEKAVAQLRGEVGQLSVLLASKLMEKELDASEQAKLVDRYIQEAGELQ